MNLEQLEALERIAELKRQGFLTDAEAENEKRRILSSEPQSVDEAGTDNKPPPSVIDLPARLSEPRENAELESERAAEEIPELRRPSAEPGLEEAVAVTDTLGEPEEDDNSASEHENSPQPPTQNKPLRPKSRRALVGVLVLVAAAVIVVLNTTGGDGDSSPALDIGQSVIAERVSASASSTHPTVTPQEPASSQSEDSSPAVTGADRLTLVASNYIGRYWGSNESVHCWKNQTELTIGRPKIKYAIRDNAKVLLQSGKEELPPIPAGGVACHTVYTSEDHELSPTSDFTARAEGYGNSEGRTLTIESVSIMTEVPLGQYYEFRNASFFSIAESFPKACMAGDDDRARRLVKANGGDVIILGPNATPSFGDLISPCTYLFEGLGVKDHPRLEATIRNPSNSDIDLEVIDVFWFNDGAALAHVQLENTTPNIGVPAGETVRFEGDFEDFAWYWDYDNPHWLINQLTLVSSHAPLGMWYGEWDDMKLTSGIEMELSLKPAAQALFQLSSRQAGFSYGDPVNLTNTSIEQRFPPQL